jgi:hypothetical protein
VSDDPIFDGYWKKVVDGWPEEAHHKAFVAYAAQVGRLDEAAVRYREIVDLREDAPAAPEAETEGDAPPEGGAPAEGEGEAHGADDAADRRADAKRRLEAVAAAAVLMLDAHKSTDPSADAKRFGRRLALGFLVVVMLLLGYLMARMYAAV